MQQPQCEQEKENDSITPVQDEFIRFSAGLKEVCEYVKRRAKEEGQKILNQLGTRMAERIVEAQLKQFDKMMVIINQYIFGWKSRIN